MIWRSKREHVDRSNIASNSPCVRTWIKLNVHSWFYTHTFLCNVFLFTNFEYWIGGGGGRREVFLTRYCYTYTYVCVLSWSFIYFIYLFFFSLFFSFFFFFSFLFFESSELANRQILVKNRPYYLKYNCASCSRDHGGYAWICKFKGEYWFFSGKVSRYEFLETEKNAWRVRIGERILHVNHVQNLLRYFW